MRYLREHPEVERQLLEAPLETLNPADQLFRAKVLESRGQYLDAKTAAERAQEGLYTAASQADVESQFDTVIEYLDASGGQVIDPVDGTIVDLASGRCYLVEAILRAPGNTQQRPIVATDWSLSVLKRDRRYLEFWGLYDRVSLLAFDARRTPFRDGAIRTMTTFVGLASLQEPGNLLGELRRVVSGTLLAIAAFYSQDDEVHAPLIHKAGLEAMIYRPAALAAFRAAGWQVEVANARSARIRPTPKGVVLEGFQVDGFPLAETTQETCVLVAR